MNKRTIMNKGKDCGILTRADLRKYREYWDGRPLAGKPEIVFWVDAEPVKVGKTYRVFLKTKPRTLD